VEQTRGKELQGKVALVTGANRGIGRGIAQAFAAAGADVVVNYRTHADEAEAVAAQARAAGGQALVWQADVADRAAVERMFAATIAHFGRLDIAVANAAFSIREPVLEAKWENVLRTIEVSQFGVFHTCQFAAQQMVKQGIPPGSRSAGKIIVISSIHQELAFPTSAAYNMSKAAVNHLVKTMAAELAPYHINVNVINPGWIDTPGERTFYSEEHIRKGAERMPWKRLGTIEDIGQAALYLASDAADYVTGSTLRVDGGFMVSLTLPGT
jgi:glucose 1-dehydrogenase